MSIRGVGMICFFAACCLTPVPAVLACRWEYLIWSIRDKTADPLFRFVQGGKAGYVDSTGKIVIEPTLRDDGNFFGEFHEGLLALQDDQGTRYLDRSGRTVLQLGGLRAFDFREGLAKACENRGTERCGFIDRAGNFVVPPQYESVSTFSEGFARVQLSRDPGTTGYVDHSGNLAIPARLSYAGDFHEGLAAAIIDGPCWLKNSGSCQRPRFEKRVPNDWHDCLFAFIDKSGAPVSELRFDDAKHFSEGLAPVLLSGSWGYVDKSGRVAIEAQFEAAEPFSDGLAAVSRSGKTGFIDRTGRFAIPPQFMSAEGFSEGRAVVQDDDASGLAFYRFIDKTGAAAFPGEFALAGSFSHGLAHVEFRGHSGGRFAWINASGQPIFTYTGP